MALESVGSTNDHAKDLARAGCAEGAVIWAKAQTAGRGRQGNVWNSIPGNLFVTFVLRPGTEAARTGQLSFAAAVALARALRPLLPDRVALELKWPNDLLIGGKKAAGILLETESSGGCATWVVIGVGVNITSAPEGAASLFSTGARETDAAEVLEALSSHLMQVYALWRTEGFAPIRAEWLDCAAGLGRSIKVRLPSETFSGTFAGIDEAGALLVDVSGQRRTIASGEVYA